MDLCTYVLEVNTKTYVCYKGRRKLVPYFDRDSLFRSRKTIAYRESPIDRHHLKTDLIRGTRLGAGRTKRKMRKVSNI